jgi:hypothetical protein
VHPIKPNICLGLRLARLTTLKWLGQRPLSEKMYDLPSNGIGKLFPWLSLIWNALSYPATFSVSRGDGGYETAHRPDVGACMNFWSPAKLIGIPSLGEFGTPH